MKRLALLVAVLAICPMLSSCLTSVAVLYVAMEADAASQRKQQFEDYHHPIRDAFAENGGYVFNGRFGDAKLSVSGGRVNVELTGCATFSGIPEQRSTAEFEQFMWDAGEPTPPWDRVWSFRPERIEILGARCENIRGAERIQMATGYKGPDRGGFGSVLFVQALRPPKPGFFTRSDQVFADAFGAP